jgi:ATP-dependent Clp protease ATP-binding subunit ClpA
MRVSPLDDGIENVFNLSAKSSFKKGQTYVNTARIFDSCLRYFAIEKEKYQKLSADIKGILGKYNINSSIFNEAYAKVYPESPTPIMTDAEATFDEDAIDVIEKLKIAAHTEMRQMDVGDMLSRMFSDKSYSLFIVFSTIADDFKTEYDTAVDAGTSVDKLPPAPFDVNILYSDMTALLVKTFVREVKSLESENMKTFLTNLNKYVAEKKDFKFIGMKNEITALEIALAGRTKKSAVLIGPAGTGKTSLVYKLADMINNADPSLPSMLRDKIIYELHLDAIVAGAQFRGQSEQRIKSILDAVSKLPNVILFIDEFHMILKNGSTGGDDSGGDATSGNILKPYISRGDVQVIGATTNDEFNQFVEKDKAITRRFKKVLIQEPTEEETIEIMKGVLPIDEQFFDKTMTDEVMRKIYKLSLQYNLAAANPDKALTMVESAFAYAKVCQANNKEVTVDDMLKELEVEYSLKMSDTKAADTRKELKSFLLGQEKPLDKLCDYLDMIDMNIVDPKRPKLIVMLAGPTGTGKTEAAKIIAKVYTGSESNLVTVAGSTLQSDTGVNAIFGSDPGYIGYKETSSFLSEVKQKPNCVVLFDEIEKASPAVFKSLLGMMDEGYVKDKAGNSVSFRNAIIIFTTNLGFGKTNATGSGLLSVQTGEGKALLEINKHFSPEFIGRMDDIIVYNRLDDSVANSLIERYRKQYADYSGIDVTFTKSEIADIKESAKIEDLGARNLEHATRVAYMSAVKRNMASKAVKAKATATQQMAQSGKKAN